MRTITLLLIAAVFGTAGFAQEEKNKDPQEFKTIFGSNKIIHGAYGGISLNYAKIDGKDSFLAGLRGIWLINHGIGIGIGGYGFANDMKFNRTIDGYSNDYSLAGGYGGLIVEPIIGAKHAVHVSFPVLIGGGGVAFIREYWTTYPQPHDVSNRYTEDSDAFFVFEPGVELEMNMVKFFRLAVGVKYRLTSSATLVGESYNLNGFSAGLTLKFGKF